MNSKTAKLKDEKSARVYKYYAAFNQSFIEETIQSLNLKRSSIIVDPWNGSGTTTTIASSLGFKSFGFDINPVMNIVSQASLSSSSNLFNVENLLKEIKKQKLETKIADREFLLKRWFNKSTASRWLKLAQVSEQILNPTEKSLYQLVLFRAVKESLKSFRSKNPTWIKFAKSHEDLISLNKSEIIELLIKTIQKIKVEIEQKDNSSKALKVHLAKATSTQIPLKSGVCDAVISSPPYCTRLEYAVNTSPELGILGFTEDDLRELKTQMIGTTVVNQNVNYDEIQYLPEYCLNLLEQIQNHPSKASKSYYFKTYANYFVLVYKSLSEIKRILKPGGQCVLIVQDSYYKDILVSLQRVYTEMLESLDFKFVDVYEYPGSGLCHIRENSSKIQEVVIKLSKVS